MAAVNYSPKRTRGAASKKDCHRFYVREHQRKMMKLILGDETYVEGDERCDKDIAWLEHLVAQAEGRLNHDGSINPLKASKRGGYGRR